jgi:hypothetical protein
MAATNTAGTPPSSFRLFKFADANKAFTGLDCLWTFPMKGMGGSSNAYRTAMPAVEVNGKYRKNLCFIPVKMDTECMNLKLHSRVNRKYRCNLLPYPSKETR